MATLALDSQKTAVTTVLLAQCELAFKLELEAVSKDITARGIVWPFLEKLQNEGALKDVPDALNALRAPGGLAPWASQTVPNVAWASIGVNQATDVFFAALQDTASPAHVTIWSAGEPYAGTWLKPEVANWVAIAKGRVNAYWHLQSTVSPLLKELEAAGNNFEANLAAIRARLDAVRANADLSCMHEPLGDRVQTTAIGPAQELLQQYSVQKMVAEIIRLPATQATCASLAKRIRSAIDRFRERQTAQTPEGVVPPVERISALLRSGADSQFATKQFVRSYGYAACCVLVQVSDPEYFKRLPSNAGRTTDPLGGLQRAKRLVDIFCGESSGGRRSGFDIKLSASKGNPASCDAALLQECMDAALDVCEGKNALSKNALTKNDKDTACTAATTKADKKLVPVPPGVKVSGEPHFVGGFKYPSQFSVGNLRTTEYCLQHVFDETGKAPSLNKLQAYFAEVVQACQAAKANWKEGMPSEVYLYKEGSGMVADWEICLKKVGEEVVIFHVSSGYKESEWFKKAN